MKTLDIATIEGIVPLTQACRLSSAYHILYTGAIDKSQIREGMCHVPSESVRFSPTLAGRDSQTYARTAGMKLRLDAVPSPPPGICVVDPTIVYLKEIRSGFQPPAGLGSAPYSSAWFRGFVSYENRTSDFHMLLSDKHRQKLEKIVCEHENQLIFNVFLDKEITVKGGF